MCFEAMTVMDGLRAHVGVVEGVLGALTEHLEATRGLRWRVGPPRACRVLAESLGHAGGDEVLQLAWGTRDGDGG